MSIRYSDDDIRRMRYEVHNFNRRRKRALKAGYSYKDLPDHLYLSELKRRFDKREDLERELKHIAEFRRSELGEVDLKYGVKAMQWDIDYIKNNLYQAKKFYDRKEKILTQRIGRFPSQKDELELIIRNREALEVDFFKLTQTDYDDMKASIKYFIRSRNKWGAGYRGFMSEVEEVMTRVGISKEERDIFFEKFKKLSYEDFFYIYEESDNIKRIYALLDSPIKSTKKMNASVASARTYINTLLNEIDILIEEAKNR